jgi:hypothetical protein
MLKLVMPNFQVSEPFVNHVSLKVGRIDVDSTGGGRPGGRVEQAPNGRMCGQEPAQESR